MRFLYRGARKPLPVSIIKLKGSILTYRGRSYIGIRMHRWKDDNKAIIRACEKCVFFPTFDDCTHIPCRGFYFIRQDKTI